jgi:hypothetical protein
MAFSLSQLTALIAKSLGPVCEDGVWRHSDNEFAPLRLSNLRCSCPPPPLSGGGPTLPLQQLDWAEVAAQYAEHPSVRPLLAFHEHSEEHPLPDELLSSLPAGQRSDASSTERLYWQLVCTSKCEAVHMGIALALRLLSVELTLWSDSRHGSEPIVDVGLVSADRVAPFERMVGVIRDAVEISAGRKVRLREGAELPQRPKKGGCAHRVLWLKTASGRQLLADFTGAQFGIDELLPATRTPFWCAPVDEVQARFGLRPRPNAGGSFMREALPLGIFDDRSIMRSVLHTRDGVLRQVRAAMS